METQKKATSEVAHLLAQMQTEYEAAARGLSGLASGVACHRFITARMERIGQLHAALEEVVGEEQAAQLLVSTLENLSDSPGELPPGPSCSPERTQT
ncbi:MAG TPA: hypothetical protein VGF67_00210 [Ktedonobacteraceae bacterium]